jgi:hypothetical protein
MTYEKSIKSMTYVQEGFEGNSNRINDLRKALEPSLKALERSFLDPSYRDWREKSGL